MHIAITGSHGLIGSALRASLEADGHQVSALKHTVEAADVDGVDAVVNLAGAPIAGGPLTEKRKAEVRDSRLRTTGSLVDAIAAAPRAPSVLVSGSAMGIYGAHRGDEELSETSELGDDFLARLCIDWEAAASAATASGVRVAMIRTSIVLAGNGGALKPQLLPYKVGLGGPTGPGTQWMSWITLDDEVAAIRHLIDHPVSGPVNLATPNPVRNADWAATLGRVLHRPAKIRLPRALAKLPAGIGELVDNLLLASQRLVPSVLTDSGFTFSQPDLEPALRAVLSA